jgi:hypothetical protein
MENCDAVDFMKKRRKKIKEGHSPAEMRTLMHAYIDASAKRREFVI